MTAANTKFTFDVAQMAIDRMRSSKFDALSTDQRFKILRLIDLADELLDLAHDPDAGSDNGPEGLSVADSKAARAAMSNSLPKLIKKVRKAYAGCKCTRVSTTERFSDVFQDLFASYVTTYEEGDSGPEADDDDSADEYDGDDWDNIKAAHSAPINVPLLVQLQDLTRKHGFPAVMHMLTLCAEDTRPVKRTKG